jgi:hypothetical protein
MATTQVRHKSHLTAIARKTLPVPTRWLLKNIPFLTQSFPTPDVLDYGCGKCHDINNDHFRCDGYDPYWRPKKPPLGKRYDLIICNYVLCTLPADERLQVLRDIQHYLYRDATAYISVRNDKPKQGWGVSSRGTYQGRVRNLPLPLLKENSVFRMFTLTKNTNLES